MLVGRPGDEVAQGFEDVVGALGKEGWIALEDERDVRCLLDLGNDGAIGGVELEMLGYRVLVGCWRGRRKG